MIPRPVASAIIVLVTVVWAINFGAQFFVEGYSPDVAINGIFMAIVGAALAFGRKGNGDNGHGGVPAEPGPEPQPTGGRHARPDGGT